MGTNFYRVPTQKEMEDRKERLQKRISELKMTPDEIGEDMRTIQDGPWEWISPWDEFVNDTSVHLGKRSMGWKFLWNFHENKYYSNKKELIEFILSGRIVDEYGTEHKPGEFIDMAVEWGQPDGLVADAEYYKKHENESLLCDEKYYDIIIDGLRVSHSTQFS